MLQAISKNVSVPSGIDIPFNSLVLDKLCDESKTDTTTFTLNHKGVYLVQVDAVVSAADTAGGLASINLVVDNVVQPQAFAAETTTALTDLHSISFATFVQVDRDNSPCRCCSSPVTISVRNTGISAVYSSINIVIKKVC